MSYDVDGVKIKEIFENKVWPHLTAIDQPQQKDVPHLYVLGGQPGAGKSNLEKQVESNHGDDFVSINGDEFRKFHPDFYEIEQKHGIESAKFTADFSGKITGMALDRAKEEKLNVLVEGTFRNAETPINTLNTFKDAGYKTTAMVATCPKDVSWSSTLGRYSNMAQAGITPRFTPKTAHDVVVNDLGKNTDTVLSSGQADNLMVFNRTELLYNSATDNGKPSDVIEKELQRPLEHEEHRSVLSNYETMQGTQERLRAPLPERTAIKRQFQSYLLRSQNKEDIARHSGLSKIQKKIETLVKTSNRPKAEIINNQARLVEKGMIKVNDKTRGHGH